MTIEQNLELIGQMDSPFVRRVAITLHLYKLPFTLRPLSVFADFDALRAINPLGTVPVLLTPQGTLTDTQSICYWLDEQVNDAFLRPIDSHALAHMQIINTANVLAQKAGELYRLRFKFAGQDMSKLALERVRIQINAGLSLLSVATPHLRKDLQIKHAHIAAATSAKFALHICEMAKLDVYAPIALTNFLARLDATQAFLAYSAG